MRIARYYLCMIVRVYCLCLYRTLGKRIFVELVPLLCGLCGAGSHQANQASSTWLAILERRAYSTCLSFREHFSGEVWCPKNLGNCWWIWSTVGQNMLKEGNLIWDFFFFFLLSWWLLWLLVAPGGSWWLLRLLVAPGGFCGSWWLLVASMAPGS